MKTKKFISKKLICCMLSLLMFVLSFSGIFMMMKESFSSFSLTGLNQITIDNSNFNSNTNQDEPFSPSGFKPTADEDSSSVTAGVINIDKGDYAGKCVTKPIADDSYVLMIDSTTKDSNGNITMHDADFGYTTEEYINLKKNSHYLITADVYTSNNNGISSLYLVDENNRAYASLLNVNSQNKWSTVSFLISTNEYTSTNVKLGLYLKRAGFVLYDNLSAFELSESVMKSNLNSLTNSNTTYTYTDKRDADVYFNNLSSTNFYAEVSGDTTFNLTDKTQDANAGDGIINSAYKISSNTKTYSKYTTVKDIALGEEVVDEVNTKITNFKQNYIYKVSVNAKATNLDGTASLELKRTDLAKEEQKSYSLNISKSSSNNLLNGYTQYNFYIKAPISKDATFNLSAILGTSEENGKSSGSLYISSISVCKVDYSTFSSASSSTDCKIDLTSDDIKDIDVLMKNGLFNSIEIADSKNPFPATPTGWSVTTGTNTQHYGVINTAQFGEIDRISNIEINPTDPGLSTVKGNNNVLMMHNTTKDTLSYTSTAKNLSKNSYYSFSVDVQLQRKNNNTNNYIEVSLVSTKDSKAITLSSLKVTTNAQEWKTVKFYLHSGYSAQDVSIKVSLVSDDEAFAYVDNAKYNYETIDKEKFNNLSINPNNSAKIDLTNLATTVSNEDFSKAELFNYSTADGVEAGVVNVSSQTTNSNVVKESNLTSFKNTDAENVIAIRSTKDVYYTLTSNVGFTFEKSKYYKVEISIFTQNLQRLTEGSDQTKKGASLKLSNFDNQFTAITSDNGWTTYSFYIHLADDAENVTSYLELALGSEFAKSTGDVFFANIKFDDSVTESEFKSKSDDQLTKVLLESTTPAKDDASTDNSTEENKTNNNTQSTNWLYYISSIIFAIAIIIAIVGVMLRKIKWKKPTKKSKTDYDRNKTVSKQYYTRKATAMRETQLIELKKDAEALVEQRTKYEEEYKHGLTKLREMKIKRASQAEISKLEKELRKNQKLSSQIGIKINSIENEIQYVKTDAYMNSLVKKLSTENPTDDVDNANNADKKDNK